MEGSGPPPADASLIESLPTVKITKEDVGEYALTLLEIEVLNLNYLTFVGIEAQLPYSLYLAPRGLILFRPF